MIASPLDYSGSVSLLFLKRFTVAGRMRFKLALLQLAHGNDESHNLPTGLDACRAAKALGADLAVFPELWSIGSGLRAHPEEQPRWDAAAIGRDSHFFRSFAALARELEMNIAITYLEAWQPKPRNSVSILDRRGEEALHYSKVCICDFGPDGGGEMGCDVNCSPGESFPVCTLAEAEGDTRVGAMICADREFPEPATQLMLNGAELNVVPNACDWDEVRSAGLLTRAWENLVGVAMANYPRPRSNGNSRAYTCVAASDGKPQKQLIAQAGEREEILIADFDVDAIRKFRQFESWRVEHRYRAARAGNTATHPK